MLDKYIYQGLHFIMKWSGQINSWAWRKQANMIKYKERIDEEEYLKELKKKL